MRVTIITIGKIKEKYLRDGIDEFLKRLRPYGQVDVVELNEGKMPERASEAERQKVLQQEGERLLGRVKPGSYVYVLDVHGKTISSEQFAQDLYDLGIQGRSDITFIIGGPFGLWDGVRRAADVALSFSPMTFTHQMVRLLLIEQLYRAVKIQRNEPYHW